MHLLRPPSASSRFRCRLAPPPAPLVQLSGSSGIGRQLHPRLPTFREVGGDRDVDGIHRLDCLSTRPPLYPKTFDV